MTTLALGLRQSSVGGSNVTPPEYPILRRDLLQEDGYYILLEDGYKLVITYGTFYSLLLEDSKFILKEDSGKLIIQAN